MKKNILRLKNMEICFCVIVINKVEEGYKNERWEMSDYCGSRCES